MAKKIEVTHVRDKIFNVFTFSFCNTIVKQYEYDHYTWRDTATGYQADWWTQKALNNALEAHEYLERKNRLPKQNQ